MLRPPAPLLLLVASIWAGCSSTSRVASRPPDAPIVIDASTDEWSGRMMRVQDGLASIGVQDDDSAIYVAFVSRDRTAIRKIVDTGLTVWLDAGGGKERRFGVRFPLGTGAARGRGPVSEGVGDFRNAHGVQGGPLEVIGEDGRPGRYGPDQASGIVVRATVEPEFFSYELAVDRGLVRPTGALGIGFETGEFGRPDGGGRARSDDRVGDARPGRARSDDPGTRETAGEGEPLRIWARVSLSGR